MVPADTLLALLDPASDTCSKTRKLPRLRHGPLL